MQRRTLLTASLGLLSLVGTVALAQAPAAPALPSVEAEVRKVDARAGKITLKHRDIPNLDMPPMTMVFQVSDPAFLSQVKAGDKVHFTAEKILGAYTVMSIAPAP